MPARPLLCSVLVVALVAGCSGVGNGLESSFKREPVTVEDRMRGPGEFWMVSILGNETDERRNQPVCSRLPTPFELIHHNQTVRYDPQHSDVDPSQVRVLLAVLHEDLSSFCPEAMALLGDPAPGETFDMGQWGRLSVTVEANGSVRAGDRWIPLGQAGHFSYEGTPTDPDVIRVDGNFTVVNLGAWDREDLWASPPY